MSQDHDEILMQYLSKVGELQKNRSKALPAEELRSIAQELGLSPEDLKAAEQSAKDHLARGQGFLKHGLLDDALKELKNALALSPYDQETMLLVAEAHLQRWHKKRHLPDKNEADRLAREVLAEAPENERAFGVLKRLDAPPKRTKLFAALAGSAALCLLGGGSVALLNSREAPPPPNVQSLVTLPPKAPLPAKTPPPAQPKAQPAAVSGEIPRFEGPKVAVKSEDGGLEVLFFPSSELSELKLQLVQSEHKVYPDSSFYELKALVKNDTGYELSTTKAQMVFLDKQGRLITKSNTDLIASYHGGLRPKDLIPFHRLERVTKELGQVWLYVHNKKKKRAPKRYAAAKPLKVVWDVPRPEHLNPKFWVRSVDQHSSFGSKIFHQVNVHVENKGEAAIEYLKLEKRLYKGGTLIEAKQSYVISSSDPSMRSGQSWSDAMLSITLPFERVEYAVVGIK